ncbi:hypothetical protein BDY24DRAFT_419128 [Mrakia frigida]|uniref:uncharacterized protein n=1 Tax=Mrakia frigida TaxID=29902 RepID=UPI003FCC232D
MLLSTVFVKPRRESLGFFSRKEKKKSSSQSIPSLFSLASSLSPKSTASELQPHPQLNRHLSLPCPPPPRSSSLPQNDLDCNGPKVASAYSLANGLGIHFGGEQNETSRPSISEQPVSTSTPSSREREDGDARRGAWMDGLLEDLERVKIEVGVKAERGEGSTRDSSDTPHLVDLSNSSSLSSLICLFPRPPSSSSSTIRGKSSDRLRISISSGRDLPSPSPSTNEATNEGDASNSRLPTPPLSPPRLQDDYTASNDTRSSHPPIPSFNIPQPTPSASIQPPPALSASSSSVSSSSVPRTPSPIPCLTLPPKRHTSLKHTLSWSFRARRAAAERKREKNELGLGITGQRVFVFGT